MADETVIEAIYDYISAVRQAGVTVSQAILFGSFARGDSRPDSDIDLIIVAPEFDERNEATVDLLWELRAFTDPRIEPIACGERQWLEDDVTPILEVARREGIVIEPEPQPT